MIGYKGSGLSVIIAVTLNWSQKSAMTILQETGKIQNDKTTSHHHIDRLWQHRPFVGIMKGVIKQIAPGAVES
jgi:hypothetical protein